jgi:predicted RND superfamily exporter protein/nucleoid DNA-binding protein
MTKAELIDRIARSRDLPPDVTKKCIAEILDVTFDELAAYFVRARITRSSTPRFTFPGFGTFTKKKRAARKGVNPQTLEPMKIPACETIDFKPGSELKAALNGERRAKGRRSTSRRSGSSASRKRANSTSRTSNSRRKNGAIGGRRLRSREELEYVDFDEAKLPEAPLQRATSGRKRKDRFFEAFGKVGMGRPGLVTVVLLVLLAISGWLGKDIEIITSRYALVSEKDAYQSRMTSFFERFGYPDSPLLVVTGGTVEERREVVDGLSAELESTEMFKGRIFARLGPEAIAEVLLLQDPGALNRVTGTLPEDVSLPGAIEGGIPGLMRLLEAQLMAGLEGEGAAEGGPVDEAQIEQGIARIGKVAALLDARLAGADTDAALAALIEDEDAQQRPETMPVDDEGYLGSASGGHLLVALFPEFTDDAMDTYRPVIEALQEIKLRHQTDTVSVLLTGTPVISYDDQSALEKGLYQSGLATGVGIFLLLALAYRGVRLPIVALVPVGITVGLTVGALMILYGHLSVVTSSFAAVLMGLGIDLSVHLIGRFHEEQRKGTPRVEGILTALRSAGPGIFVGSLTTALAFVTLFGAKFTAYGELGALASAGLAIAFVVALIVIPAFLASERFVSDEAPAPLPGVSTLMGLLRRAYRPLLVTGIVAAVLGGASLTNIEFNTRFFDHLPADYESAQAVKMLEEDGTLDPVFAFVTAENVEEARDKSDALRKLGMIKSVQSVSDMLPDLDEEGRRAELEKTFSNTRRPDFDKLRERKRDRKELDLSVRAVVDALEEIKYALEQGERDTKAVDETTASFKKLRKTVQSLPEDGGAPLAGVELLLADVLGRAWNTAANVAERGEYAIEDVPMIFRRRHAARDGSAAVSLYAFPSESLYDRDAARRFRDEIETVDDRAAGVALTLHYHMSYIIDDFLRASLIAGVLVFFLLLVDMRSVVDALLGMSPALIGWLWMVGVFVLTGTDFGAANVGCLPLVLGIGVDAGAHVMHRVRESAEEGQGIADLDELFSGTGAAVLLSSVTTIVAFGGLMIAEHEGMVSFGLMMVIGIASTLLASLVLLPSLLLAFGRAK